jgi:hypothetical protein
MVKGSVEPEPAICGSALEPDFIIFDGIGVV